MAHKQNTKKLNLWFSCSKSSSFQSQSDVSERGPPFPPIHQNQGQGSRALESSRRKTFQDHGLGLASFRRLRFGRVVLRSTYAAQAVVTVPRTYVPSPASLTSAGTRCRAAGATGT